MEAARFAVGPSRCIAQQADLGGKAEGTLNVFFDSSALAKRCIEEKGSDQVQAILSSASALAVSVICVPEIVSALCRRRRERKLQRKSIEMRRHLYFRTLTTRLLALLREVIALAVALLEQFPSVVRMRYISPAPRMVD